MEGLEERRIVLLEEMEHYIDAVDLYADREDSDPVIRCWIQRLDALSLTYTP